MQYAAINRELFFKSINKYKQLTLTLTLTYIKRQVETLQTRKFWCSHLQLQLYVAINVMIGVVLHCNRKFIAMSSRG